MLHWLFSCVLFMSSAAFSFGCTFCHPAEEAIDPETSLCSSSTRKNNPKPNQLPPFKLAFLAVIHSCLGILQGSKDMTVLPQFGRKPSGLISISCKGTDCIFTPALRSIKDIWKEARNAKDRAIRNYI